MNASATLIKHLEALLKTEKAKYEMAAEAAGY